MKQYGQIEGDGGSDVLGQVLAQRRAMAESLQGVSFVVAIASGKGGVGKSTMTLALACALLARGRKVAVLDCDLNGPCQAQIAGLSGVPWVPDGDRLVMPRREDGLGVVSLGGVLGAGQPMQMDSVAQGDEHTWRATREMSLLGQLITATRWDELDYLLVDLPPGADRTVHHLGLLGPTTEVVLVSLPSALAVGVVARSLAAVRGFGIEPVGYIENMAGYYCRDCDAIRPLFARADRPLDLQRLGSIPFDPELALRCDLGWPTSADDTLSLRAIDEVAGRLIRKFEEDNPPDKELR